MEDRGKNLALFQQIQCFSTPHRHLIGEYPVHLPALSGTGQAAGVAAAQSIAENRDVQNIDIETLVGTVRKLGAII